MLIRNALKKVQGVSICLIVQMYNETKQNLVYNKQMDLNWYKTLNKSALTPPDWIFGPVWTILYILMFISLWIVIKDGEYLSKIPQIVLFFIQLGLNLLWPQLFFAKHNITMSFIDIVLLVIVLIFTIISFWQVSHLASILLIPYLLWVSFATYLNYKIMVLN